MMNNQDTISPEKQTIALFPDYVTEIKSLLSDKDEIFIELVNDLLFCKREFFRLSNLDKPATAHKYQKTIEDLQCILL